MNIRTTSVLAAPLMDPLRGPDQARRCLEVPHGLSLLQIARRAFPGLPTKDLEILRLTLVSPVGTTAIDAQYWATTRPRPGVRVVIRMVPGKDTMRSVLMAVVSVAALAFASPVAAALGVSGAFATSLVGAGLSVVGALLVNALVPMPEPDQVTPRSTYSITGWTNTVRPEEPVPLCFGRHRTAPPFAAPSYTEVVGDLQYVRALFCFGYGPLKVSDIRIGNTALSEFDEVDYELREGRAGDLPVTLYPRQVLEQSEGIELSRPAPRDDAGQIISGPSVETPVVRQTAADTQEVNVILAFPSGIHAMDNKGRVAPRQVDVRIRQRLAGDSDWQEVVLLEIAGRTVDPIYRQHHWTLPSRGRWEIEVTRLSDEESTTRSILSSLQSIRPEYPINIDTPLALLAVRIKATHQLNSSLDSVNALVERETKNWDGTAWTDGLSRNPAAAFVALLQGASNPFQIPNSEIDWDSLQDWSEWCASKGLKYDRVAEQSTSLGDLLREICAAGRAFPRHDGLRWGVVIDRPSELVVDHISPRNSDGFSWSRSYFEPPHAFRVTFFDETNNYEPAERIIPWPGHEGDITLTEQIQLPGKTDPEEIWIEARRRMYELLHRADSFTASQSGAARVVTRGDLVMGSYDVLSRDQVSARVTRIEGALIELDEAAPDAEMGLGLRFRVFADDEDSIGTSRVRSIRVPVAGAPLVELTDSDDLPAVGDLVHIGPLEQVSLPLRVRGVESGQAFTSTLNMVPAAPEIDLLTDAEIAPDWTGRVGTPLVLAPVQPAPPHLVSVTSDPHYTEGAAPGDPPVPAAASVDVALAPASGPVTLGSYRLSHKLSSESTWTDLTLPVASGTGHVEGYVTGEEITLRATAIALDGTESLPSSALSITVGGGSIQLPGALDPASVMATAGLGHAKLSFVMPPAPAQAVTVYRVPDGETLDRAAHALAQPVSGGAGSTVTYVDGDATRTNLLADPSFDGDGSDWAAGTGWAISAGQALHAPGSAGGLAQSVPLENGQSYRFSATLAAVAAGAVTPELVGPSPVAGAAISAAGLHHQTLVANATTTGLTLAATAAFHGQIEELAFYAITTGTLTTGIYHYYLEPRTDTGLPGPMSGPISVSII